MDPVYQSRLLRQMNYQNVSATEAAYSPRTPTRSTLSNRSSYGDRMIPSRAGARWSVDFRTPTTGGTADIENENSVAYSAILQNELLGGDISRVDGSSPISSSRLFTYAVSPKGAHEGRGVSPYSLYTLSNNSHKLLQRKKNAPRVIADIPYKGLHVPGLHDNYYHNLLDWSSRDVLSVGLGSKVYLWGTGNSQVTHLCDLAEEGDFATSVSFSERGDLVSVGTHNGYIQIWDVAAERKVSVVQGHFTRVGCLGWNANQLSSGSNDRSILQQDVRTPPRQSERRLHGHEMEVCGLKWSPNHQLLASGGNDNKLLVWDCSRDSPLQQFTEHTAAVKAIAWSPHQRNLLASGGGTKDGCIRFWSTQTGQLLQCTDTGSQVCNLAWSKNVNELVSSHGAPLNELIVWTYPSLTQLAKFSAHGSRVLYMAVSPDEEAVVTGSGDQTLRFWKIWKNTRSKKSPFALSLLSGIR